MSDITEEEIARAIRDSQHMPPPCDHPQCDCGWDCEREALSVAAYTKAARAVLALVLPAIERARVEERERTVDGPASAKLDRLERAAMAYERLGKLSRDDEKTRQIRKDTIAELAAARADLAAAIRKG